MAKIVKTTIFRSRERKIRPVGGSTFFLTPHFVILERLEIRAELVADFAIVAVGLDVLGLDMLVHVGAMASAVSAHQANPHTIQLLLHPSPHFGIPVFYKNGLKGLQFWLPTKVIFIREVFRTICCVKTSNLGSGENAIF